MKISLPGTLLLLASLSITAHVSGQTLQITSPANLPAGTVNLFYSYQFTASGANGNTLIWTAPNGTPGGLTLDEATGVLSGTPIETSHSFQVEVAYSNGAQSTPLSTFNFTAAPAALGITATSPLPFGTVGVSYSTAITGTGGTAPYTWSITDAGVPGLSIDPNSGVLAGIPTQAGVFTFTVALVDAARNSDNRQLQITINNPGGTGPIITSSAALPNAEQYAAYSFTFAASGGDGTFTWNVSSGSSLPPGLSLSSAGVLSGTPTVGPGTYSFGVQVQSNEQAADQTVILTVIAPVTIASSSPLPSVDVGSPYSFPFDTAGGQGPFSWSIDSSAPPGLSIDATTGVLSGTPTTAGLFTFNVTVTDSLNGTYTQAFQITVNPALVITSTSPLPSGQAQTFYSFQFAASGGSGAYTWSVPSGSSLPAGLSLSSSGFLSGTPASAQSASFGITVADTAGGIATRTFQLQIAAGLGITSNSPLPPGTVGSPYTFTFQASGGSSSNTWSIVSGTLPGGLSLNSSTGVLSGTPSGVGSFVFTVGLSDAQTENFVSKAFALNVTSTFAITSPANLPDGTAGVNYNEQLTTSGGFGSVVWSLQSGTLPTGITLSPSGLLSGTASSAGTFNFTVQAVDGATPQDTATKALSLQIIAGLTIRSGSPLPAGVVGTAYSFTFQAIGGSGAYSWSLASGSGPLPGGLSLNGSSGVLSGTPSGTGHFSFTVQLTDTQITNVVTKTFSLDITSNFAITSPSNLPAGTAGATYSQQLTTSGGFGSVAWSLVSGALPAGVTLSASGLLSGTASTAGTYNFTVQAADGATPQDTATKAFTVQIGAGLAIISASPLPAGTVASPYSFTFLASGGSGSYTWSLASGSGPLPGGLSLSSSTGVLSGSPSGTGTFGFTVQVSDTQRTISKAFTLDITSNFTITSPANLPLGTVGTAYHQQLATTGGFGSVVWSLASGGLPAGVTLSTSGGLLSGSPSTAGTYNFTVQAVDSATPHDTATKALSVQVVAPLTISNSSPLPAGTVASPYALTFAAVGGSGSYTWSKSSGSLPGGLTLNSVTGALSGTPSGTGHFVFAIQVTDTQRSTAKNFTLDISTTFAISSPANLPSGAAAISYNEQLTTTGGFGSVVWSLTSGSLPAGVTLSPSGLLSGTPSTAATYNFTVQAVDSATPQDTATKALTVQIGAGLTISSSSPLAAGTVASAYSFTFVAVGGSGSYTWSKSSGSLPGGLTLNSVSGTLSGTPTGTGHFTFAIQVTDSQQSTAKNFALDISSNFAVSSPANLPSGAVAVSYSQQLTSTGGFAPVVWSVTSGSLPAGITLSSSGLLSGSPSTAGTYNFAVQALDSATPQDTATKALTVQIGAGLTISSSSPLAAGTVASPYSFTFAAVGGSGSYTWSKSSGSLPGGLTLNGASGTLSGTPSGTGHFTFGIHVTDSQQSTTKNFALDISSNFAVSSPANLPSGTVASSYGPQQLTTTGGFGSIAWSKISGTLPTGITLSPSGLLSGSPSTAGTYNFTVQATDSATPEDTATKALTLQVVAGLTISSNSPLTAGAVASPYSFTFVAVGGSGSYTWSKSSGSLPGGLTLNSVSGVLSGTPSGTGSFSFVIQVTDTQREDSTSKGFSLDIASNFIITSPGTLPNAAVPGSYSQQLTSSGGFGSIVWSLASGALPAGITLSPSGLLSGSASTAGTYNFTVQAVDSANPQDTATKALTLQVVAGLTISSNSPLTAGAVASPYSFTFVAVGGSGSYTWSKSSGSLPGGLTLNSVSGVLSGTPSGTGSFSFVIQVTDTQREDSTSKGFSLDIASNFIITSPATLPSAAVPGTYSQQLTSSGGVGSVVWSKIAGTLPTGITLSPSGLLSGSASTAGPYNFTVQAVDSANPQDTATKALSIQAFAVVPPLSITSPSAPSGQFGIPYSFTATGGAPPYTWSVIGALPPGLALSPSGVLSGTPTRKGPYSFTVQVMDVERSSASQAEELRFTLPPAPPLQITGIPTNPPANSQPTFQVTLPTAYSFDIQGVLTLTFNSPSGIDDPAIQFTNGTRNLAFTIPAGSTVAGFATGETPVFLTGTIAGTITLTVTQYQALGTSLTPVPAPVQVVISPTAPIITSVTATRTGNGFTVTIVGYSPTRELTGGTFSFLGSNLDTPQLTLDLNSLFQGWYSSTTSDQFGSQFKLTQPFNLQGGSGNVKTVSITLTNSIGTSQLASAQVE